MSDKWGKMVKIALDLSDKMSKIGIMRLKKREFVRQISKYLELGGSYELESCGVVVHSVTISKPVAKVEKVEVRKFNTYGCGCEKGDEFLCKKHGRS